MRALVVYESMYGNTHKVAVSIARGLQQKYETDVVSVHGATPALVRAADLLVVGGPTHIHTLTSEKSRDAAIQAAAKDHALRVDPSAPGDGLRGWFRGIVGGHRLAAAFDTRIDAPAAITGRASRGISRRLRRRGFTEVVPAESFLVDKQNHLLPGETDRAEVWGIQLANTMALR